MCPDFLLTQRRVGFDFQLHLRKRLEIAPARGHFDRLPALAAQRENPVQVRPLAGDDAISEILAALVAEVADLKKIIALLRHGEINQ